MAAKTSLLSSTSKRIILVRLEAPGVGSDRYNIHEPQNPRSSENSILPGCWLLHKGTGIPERARIEHQQLDSGGHVPCIRQMPGQQAPSKTDHAQGIGHQCVPGLPAMAGLAVSAEPLVELLLTEKVAHVRPLPPDLLCSLRALANPYRQSPGDQRSWSQ